MTEKQETSAFPKLRSIIPISWEDTSSSMRAIPTKRSWMGAAEVASQCLGGCSTAPARGAEQMGDRTQVSKVTQL